MYQTERLLVNCNTNNGTERQNESFKYSYLRRHTGSSLTGMLTVLVEDFLVDKYDRYSHSLTKCMLFQCKIDFIFGAGVSILQNNKPKATRFHRIMHFDHSF